MAKLYIVTTATYVKQISAFIFNKMQFTSCNFIAQDGGPLNTQIHADLSPYSADPQSDF